VGAAVLLRGMLQAPMGKNSRHAKDTE